MQSSNQKQTTPEKLDALPEKLTEWLDGNHLEFGLKDSLRLTTMSADGWPHAAQLSLGECLAVSSKAILIATWPGSTTTKNMKRLGQVLLSLAWEGALLEIRATAALAAEHISSQRLSAFRLDVDSVLVHKSAYATVTSGITFKLHDEEKTLIAWREQIEALKALNS